MQDDCINCELCQLYMFNFWVEFSARWLSIYTYIAARMRSTSIGSPSKNSPASQIVDYFPSLVNLHNVRKIIISYVDV